MQFNDLYLLDVENKDWADLDMPWNVPRWNLSAQVVEAIPSWRVFLFGGVCDKHQEGRSMGVYDDTIGVFPNPANLTFSNLFEAEAFPLTGGKVLFIVFAARSSKVII